MRSRPRFEVIGVAANVLAGALLATGLIVLARHNLGYRGMWWDEAEQFWISRGLSNYSHPFAVSRGLHHVIWSNRLFNLDPGGYSILLYYWSRASSTLARLRGLSFAFFLAQGAGLALLGWHLTRKTSCAIGAFALPLMSSSALHQGFEIRAYSMEMAGVALGAYLLARACETLSFRRLFILGATCALFLSSRYSFVLFAGALAIACATASLRPAAGLKTRLCGLLCLLAPVVVSGLVIARYMLRGQLWPEMKNGRLGIAAPGYARDSVLWRNPDIPGLVFRNILSPLALPITIALLSFFFLRRFIYRALQNRVPAGELECVRRRTDPLYVLILSIEVLSIAVSALGLYPWDIVNRWSAYLVTISAVSVVVVGGEALLLFELDLSHRVGPSALESRASWLGAAVLLLFVSFGTVRSIFYRQRVETPARANVALQIDRLPASAFHVQNVFVVGSHMPVVRYLYEYGPYKGRPEYPRAFRFETLDEWGRRLPIHAEGLGIDFIISPLSVDGARARFPDATLRRVASGDCRLLEVVHKKANAPVSRGARRQEGVFP